jgi:hypothetical protein
MQITINGRNWKRHFVVLGLIFLLVGFVIGLLSGGGSTAAADSNACDAYFVGMSLGTFDVTDRTDPLRSGLLVHAISKEKGLLTVQETEYEVIGEYPFSSVYYYTVSCRNVRTFHEKIYPNVYQ